MLRFGRFWYYLVNVWQGLVSFGKVLARFWQGLERFGKVRCGLIRFDSVGKVWLGLARFGKVW